MTTDNNLTRYTFFLKKSGFSENSGQKSGFMKIWDKNWDVFENVPNLGLAPEFGMLWAACIGMYHTYLAPHG